VRPTFAPSPFSCPSHVPMPPLVDTVRRSLERAALIPPGARVLVAVSGGSDSVALLYLMRDLAPSLGFEVAGLGHLNHELRGAESDRDEVACRELATALDVPIVVERADVGALARAHRVSVEVAARRARYRFLDRAAAHVQADTVATGHTRDDQAETFLLRLLRGAGATGLSAIPPRRGMFVRPILGVRREALRTFLRERGVAFCDDSTNADTRIPRNWIRHELLPLLATRLNSDIVEVLAREVLLLRDDAAFLDAVADEAARRILRDEQAGRVTIPAAELVGLPPSLARRVVRRALFRTSPAFQGASPVERVLDMAIAEGEGHRIDLPGVRVERIQNSVVLQKREGRGHRPAVEFRFALPVPGRVVVPDAGAAIDADMAPHGHIETVLQERVASGADGAGAVASIDASVAADGLWVRSRRPGDALRPLGMAGRKKLQDVLVDRKVPRARRDHVPIVVDARDRIVWVAGIVLSDDARVTASTQSVVTLVLNILGDLG
jgi:tRNA(Ile)-lysidine synthase